MTTQNVAWPTMIVINPRLMSNVENVVRSAMPVITPGSAIGSTRKNEIGLAAEEVVALDGQRGQRASSERQRRRGGGAR